MAVSAEVAEEIRDYLLERNMPGGAQPLLLNTRGERWTRQALGELIARIGKKAGIRRFRVSPHKLRHTANVIAKAAALDPFTRSRLLGHRSTRTLQRYGHILPGELRTARETQRGAYRRYLGNDPP